MRVASLLKAAPLFAAAALSFMPKQAEADSNCTLFYTIQPGDTLSSIATLAYGNSNYQLIFSRNFGSIKDPRNLEAGSMLMIPCNSGVSPEFDRIVAEQVAAQAEVETESKKKAKRLK